MNALKTALLLGILSGLLLAIGEMVGGRNGLYTALAIAVAMNFFGYFFSDKMALSMYSAQPVTLTENSDVYARVFPLVQSLTQRMGLPMPKLWLIPDESPNAFATGRNPNHAAVAATEGILQMLTDEELEGVLGHELTHVKHRDILISSVAATLAAAIMMISRFAMFFGGSRDNDRQGANPIAMIATIILAPIAAILIQAAISRSREYDADKGGAALAGSPRGLVSALRKIDAGSQAIPLDVDPSMSHMFIVNPFSVSGLMGLFSTHPPTEDRIQALLQQG
jgi:heat shock protein HtpX